MLTTPEVHSTFCSIGRPAGSKGFESVKEWRIEAAAINMESEAKNLPGQIRLPKPKRKRVGSGDAGSMNLSGLNDSGSA